MLKLNFDHVKSVGLELKWWMYQDSVLQNLLWYEIGVNKFIN